MLSIGTGAGGTNAIYCVFAGRKYVAAVVFDVYFHRTYFGGDGIVPGARILSMRRMIESVSNPFAQP
jgi:hypothetical protein